MDVILLSFLEHPSKGFGWWWCCRDVILLRFLVHTSQCFGGGGAAAAVMTLFCASWSTLPSALAGGGAAVMTFFCASWSTLPSALAGGGAAVMTFFCASWSRPQCRALTTTAVWNSPILDPRNLSKNAALNPEKRVAEPTYLSPGFFLSYAWQKFGSAKQNTRKLYMVSPFTFRHIFQKKKVLGHLFETEIFPE